MAYTGDTGTVFGSIMTEASADRGCGEDECEDVGEGDSSLRRSCRVVYRSLLCKMIPNFP